MQGRRGKAFVRSAFYMREISRVRRTSDGRTINTSYSSFYVWISEVHVKVLPAAPQMATKKMK